MADKLVPATVSLWSKVAARMLPTPAKFHYLFNMRELSKVPLTSPCLIWLSAGGRCVEQAFRAMGLCMRRALPCACKA